MREIARFKAPTTPSTVLFDEHGTYTRTRGGSGSAIIYMMVGIVSWVGIYIAFRSGVDYMSGNGGGSGSGNGPKVGTDRPIDEDALDEEWRKRAGNTESWDGRGRRFREMSDATLLHYYYRNYPGLTRGQLQLEDPSLYNELHKRGLNTRIPLSGFHTSWASMTDAQMIQYYYDNYSGVTRGQLQHHNGGFYNALRQRGLIDQIPLAETARAWSKMTDAQVMQYYYDNYAGVRRGDLQKIDSSYYQVLRKRGLLNIVPLRG